MARCSISSKKLSELGEQQKRRVSAASLLCKSSCLRVSLAFGLADNNYKTGPVLDGIRAATEWPGRDGQSGDTGH